MSSSIDMSTPVTRGELREELEILRNSTRQDLDALRNDTRRDLEIWGGALLERIKQGEDELKQLKQELTQEIGRSVKSAMEWAVDQFRAIDGKYADLPGRVAKLETALARAAIPERRTPRPASRVARRRRDR